ncbi:Increased recombination centers protein 22 [Pichia californica]|uniref:Increased recombination centers protein 22 n=1 Tax=Pichia californica TaxID=460514 RepID=A0A9P6WGQ6_9ASCO|nr:Increased recombination centers protein 22 [[Candida] californica]KAG0686811.1 Increased recombination centers protein 22 [[Candida] californica]
MKLSLLTSLLALSASVFADDSAVAGDAGDVEEREIVTDPNFVPTPEKPFNFAIDYVISFKEDEVSSQIDDLLNGETIELSYKFKNLEPTEVSVVGVGGELLDPVTGLNMANITASQIGPVSVLNNQTAAFTQRVGINLEPGKYLLVPAIYVVYQDQFMLLGSVNKIVNVVEPKISFFNPQLILAELILLASIAGIGYFLYTTFAASYLAGILPESLLPVDKKKKKASKSPKNEIKEQATQSNIESWLPDSHKNLTKKSKKKL